MHIKIYHRRKMLIVAAFIVGIGLVLMGRLAYLRYFGRRIIRARPMHCQKGSEASRRHGG